MAEVLGHNVDEEPPMIKVRWEGMEKGTESWVTAKTLAAVECFHRYCVTHKLTHLLPRATQQSLAAAATAPGVLPSGS